LNDWPDQLPDWVFWLLVVVMPTLFTMRLLWQMYGPALRPPPTRMVQDDVVALARSAIKREWPTFDSRLHVAEWPRPNNGMIWLIRQATVGSWWIVQIDDATGEVRDVQHQGVR
jgi:hypothetical protein